MATDVVHNHQSVRLGAYPTPRGQRELVAVRVDGEVTIFDMLVNPLNDDGDRDERTVEEHLVTVAEIRGIAADYLERAARFGRPMPTAL
jgi:hypothetical protein